MSAVVRTSSRIKARKNKLASEVSSPTDASPPPRKKRNDTVKEEQQSSSQQITPSKKNALSQATPSPAKATRTATTSVIAVPKPSSAPSSSVATATTTIATRSSALRAAPSGEVQHQQLPPQSTPTTQPTHIFKNPNFMHSSKGGVAAGKKTRTWKTLKQIIVSERAQPYREIGSTYSSIDAPPSFKPAKKYSDISGLPAKYTDPRTKLRYATAEEFAQLRMLPTDIVNGLLALRRANLEVQ